MGINTDLIIKETFLKTSGLEILKMIGKYKWNVKKLAEDPRRKVKVRALLNDLAIACQVMKSSENLIIASYLKDTQEKIRIKWLTGYIYPFFTPTNARMLSMSQTDGSNAGRILLEIPLHWLMMFESKFISSEVVCLCRVADYVKL